MERKREHSHICKNEYHNSELANVSASKQRRNVNCFNYTLSFIYCSIINLHDRKILDMNETK